MDSLPVQVLTLLVTGLLVPALMRFVDLRLTAAATARQAERERRLELLERLTKVVWQWRYNAKQIAYYGASLRTDPARFDTAVAAYEAHVWDQFVEIKTVKSAFMVRLDEHAAAVVEALYAYLKDEIDLELTTLVGEARAGSAREVMAAKFVRLSERFTKEVTDKVERELCELARSIRA